MEYEIIVGAILLLMAILMKLGILNFIIKRYESFYKIKNKNISVDENGLQIYYSILFLVVGLIMLISGIVKPNQKTLSSVFWFLGIGIGIIGILYLNNTDRYIIKIEEQNIVT